MQHPIDRQREVGEFDRLHEIVHRPLRQRLSGGGRIVHRRQHHDGEVGVDVEGDGDQLETRHTRHADVGEHQHMFFAGEQVECRRRRVAGAHLEAARPEELGERRADEFLIVHNEDAPHGRFGRGADRSGEARGLEGAAFVHRGVGFMRGQTSPLALRYAVRARGPALGSAGSAGSAADRRRARVREPGNQAKVSSRQCLRSAGPGRQPTKDLTCPY